MRQIIILLFFSFSLHGQIIINNSSTTGGGTGGSVNITDNFDSYNVGVLYGEGQWLQERGVISVYRPASDGSVHSDLSGAENAVYYNASISGDQWCQGIVEAMGSTTATGLAVRCQGGTGSYYGWYSTTTQSYLFRNVGETWTQFATGTAWNVADIVKLEIEGYELKCYRNGNLDTSVSGDGLYTDSDGANRLDGGYVGISGYSNLSVTRLDNYTAGGL